MNKHFYKSLSFAISIVLTSACSSFLQAQSPSSAKKGAKTSSSAQARIKHEKIRARAGESLRSIAERAGVSADELAALNHLYLKSKLKKGQSLLLPSAANTRSPNAAVNEGLPNGKLIKFLDGGTQHVDNAWWRGDDVWYTLGKVTQTTSRKVKSIEPVFVAGVDSANPATPPPVAVPKGSEKTPVPIWIYLVGGARMKVDEVNKTSGGAWYQRGNLLSFLADARIKRIEREAPGTQQPAWQDQGWSSGSPLIDQLIKTNSARFGVDPYLVFLVIEQESHFRTRALSPKGAQGLMQLMPGTARRFGVRRTYDAAENIRGGTQYLKELLTMFKGRVDLALASYNAGEHRVIQFGNKVPPFQETQNYVKRINQRYKKGSGPKNGKTPAVSGIRPAIAEVRP